MITPNLTLSGIASDNISLGSVSWTNSTGGSGTCIGLESWTTSSITLFPGKDKITITAKDSSNNTVTDTITVTYKAH